MRGAKRSEGLLAHGYPLPTWAASFAAGTKGDHRAASSLPSLLDVWGPIWRCQSVSPRTSHLFFLVAYSAEKETEA